MSQTKAHIFEIQFAELSEPVKVSVNAKPSRSVRVLNNLRIRAAMIASKAYDDVSEVLKAELVEVL